MTWHLADIDRLLINQNGFWECYCSNNAGNVRGTRSHIIEGYGLGCPHPAYPAGNMGVDNLRCVLRRLAELFPSLDHRTTGAKSGQGDMWEPAMPPGWLPSDCTFATVVLGRFTGTNLLKPIGEDHSTLPRLFVFLRHGHVHLALDYLAPVRAAWRGETSALWVRRHRDRQDGLLITSAPVCCTALDDELALTKFLKAIYMTLPARPPVPAIYPGLSSLAEVAGNNDEDENEDEAVAGDADGEVDEEGSDEHDRFSGTPGAPVTCRIHCKPYEPQSRTPPTTVFETLYDLALDIRTKPHLAHLTVHHTACRCEAERALQEALLSMSTVPASCNQRWDIVRAFALNFFAGARKVNNIFRTVVTNKISCVQKRFTGGCADNPEEFLISEFQKIANSTASLDGWGKTDTEHLKVLIKSLERFTQCADAPKNQSWKKTQSWADWAVERRGYWIKKSNNNINIDCQAIKCLIHDINLLTKLPHGAQKRPTGKARFDGMAFALGANFFADIGLVWFVKPDLHVNGIIKLLGLLAREGDDDKRNFSAVIELTKIEATIINEHHRFRFLDNRSWGSGLYPRQLDRLIYLIGSDNHSLDDNKNKQQSKERHKLMVERLVQAGFLGAAYWGRI